MIGSDILTEHHLTPVGWAAGNPPADRVETWTRRVFEEPALCQGGSSLALRVGFTRRDAGRSGCSACQARSLHVGVRSLPSAVRIDRSAPLTPDPKGR